MKVYNQPDNHDACPDRVQTFRGWEAIVRALIKSGEISVLPGERVSAISVCADGLYVAFEKRRPV